MEDKTLTTDIRSSLSPEVSVSITNEGVFVPMAVGKSFQTNQNSNSGASALMV